METVGAVILAAGGSSRLGRPKQLLKHHGETLVRRAANHALAAGCSPVVVVVGGQRSLIEEELKELSVEVLFNPGWASGIGTSIRMGVEHVATHPLQPDAIILMVCDQPFQSPQLLRDLVNARVQGGKLAAACAYAGTFGVPALFARPLFSHLMALPGPCGARSVLQEMADDVAAVEFPFGAIDIDTPDDCERHLV